MPILLIPGRCSIITAVYIFSMALILRARLEIKCDGPIPENRWTSSCKWLPELLTNFGLAIKSWEEHAVVSTMASFLCVPSIKSLTTLSLVIIKHTVSCRSCFGPHRLLSIVAPHGQKVPGHCVKLSQITLSGRD
jgi:hypothetical protein